MNPNTNMILRGVANAINARGALIALRTVTPPPAGPIPPLVTSPVLAASLAQFAGTLAINCGVASGQLSAGDIMLLNGQRLIVSAPVTARTQTVGIGAQTLPGFDGVTFMPLLNGPVTAGAPIAFTWAADKPLRAMIAAYSSRVVDGVNVLLKDLRVTIAAYGNVVPDPETQRLVIGGDVRTIINITPVYVLGQVAKWDIQAR